MKKLFSILLLVAVVVVCATVMPVEAQAETSGDYTYSISNGKATITDCDIRISGNVTIPSTLGGYPVVSIGRSAFAGCRSLTSITIPNSVTSLGEDAFNDCSGLTSITIPEGATYIGSSAFADCTSLTSITIPNSVTSLGEGAFRNCNNLTYNEYNNAKYIGNSANPYLVLMRATSSTITFCSIHDETKLISNGAFSYCRSLTSVTFGNSVTSIGPLAFEGCTSLTSITIPEGVTSIGDCAFEYCYNLSSISIPDSIVSIGENAFAECDSLEYTFYDNAQYLGNENNPYTVLIKATSTGITKCEIHRATRVIYEAAFMGCRNLTGIIIPDSVVSIHYGAFEKCSSLTNVKLSENVTHIEHYAFADCSNLTNITFPKSVIQMPANAFLRSGLRYIFYKGSEQCWDSIHVDGFKPIGVSIKCIHYNCTGNEVVDSEKGTCSACQAICTHRWICWTGVDDTTHKHTCSVCQKEETTNHSWNGGSVAKKATCKEAGIKTYICTACNATKTEAIVKLTTHTYDHACDTDCNVCGVTRSTTHNYKTTWSKDKTNHWHECSICKDKKDMVAHTPGAEATETTPQTCTTCGYIIKPNLGHTHKYATGWTTDENGHWYVCAGCEEQGSYATHTPGAEATATTDQTCTVCGYVLKEATGETEPAPQPTEPSSTEATQPESTPATPTEPTTTPVVPTEPAGDSEPSADPTVWIIVAVAVVVLGGGAGAGIIIRKKKH